jgi:DNA-binding protein YbaB
MTTSPFADQLAQSMAALRRHQELIAQTSRDLANATVSATSRDRGITVVVGGRGELREIKFHSEEYRSMSPAELSSVLVEVGNQAREQMARKATDALLPLSSFGAELRESMTGGTELEEQLAPLRAARQRTFDGTFDGSDDADG